MISFFTCLSLVAALAGVHARTINDDPRKEEFSRMGSYELMSISVHRDASDTPTAISFSAYGEDYTLELEVNEALVFGKVRHTNGIPEESEGYITSLTTSCHYLVRSEGFVGGVSVCPGRGVRGRVQTEDDVLIFRPSSFYLSEEFARSETSDEHLVFRMSEFDMEGIPLQEGMMPPGDNDVSDDLGVAGESNLLRRLRKRGVQTRGLDESKIPKIDDMELFGRSTGTKIEAPLRKSSTLDLGHKDVENVIDLAAEDLSGSGSRRKLMQYNSGNNQVELLVFVDPATYEKWRSTYGTSAWYEEGAALVGDYINDVTAVYEATNWGNSVGGISVHLVEIEVATSFSGTYASLRPDFTGGCSDYTTTNCPINGSGYLNKLATWIGYYKDTSTFDNVQLLTHMSMGNAAGWGYIGTVCRGSNSCSNTALLYGYNWGVRTIAHELGHNMNCRHDQDTPCGINAGLMGYGNGEGFSSCSISAVQTYFQQRSGLSCLGTGVRSFTSNFGDGSTFDDDGDDTVATPAPVPTYNTGGDDDDDDTTSGDCIQISGLTNAQSGSYTLDFNSKWTYESTYNSKPYYVMTIEGSTWYMYYSAQYQETFINSRLSDTSAWAYCFEEDPLDCTSFGLYANGWIEDEATVTDCSTGDDGGDYTDDSDEGDCQGYSCFYIRNLDTVNGVDYNGEWVPTGCHNDKAYYTRNGYYLYFSATYNNWHIYRSLDDQYASAYCYYETLTYCSGVIFTAQGSWTRDRDSVVSYCSGVVELAGMAVPGSDYVSAVDTEFDLDWEFSYNCSVPYDAFCIYNDGSLWNGDASFTYSACKDGYPYFYYAYEEGNFTMVYYLHYNSLRGWYLSERDLMDTTGVAYCQEADITNCGAGTWYISNDTITDMVSYDLSETMKYEETCIVSDSSSAYCTSDSTGACAMWQMELSVIDSTQQNKVCDVLDANCVTEGLNGEFSQAYASMQCSSDYDAKLYLNVTFDTTAGYVIYSEFVEDYESLVDTCEGSDNLDVEVVYSTLHVCESCSSFVPAESGARRFGVVGVGMIAIVVSAVLAWIDF